MTFLPPEIYGIVAEHVSSPLDLASLLLVEAAVRVEAERVLYREIHISTYNPATLDSLLDRLSSTPRQAILVQMLNMSFTTTILDSTQAKLAPALRALNNLRDLRICIPDVQLNVVTRGCTFQLRRFECFDDSDRIAAWLGDFLLHQPLIRHLSIPTYGRTDPMPEDILPHLDTLLCPGNLAEALNTARRSIERLSWRSDERLFRMPSCGPYPTLLVLVLRGLPNDYDLPTHAPNLRLLQCHINTSAEIYPMLVESIKGLQHLHTLGGTRPNSQRHHPSSEAVDTVAQDLMEAIESLQLVQMGEFQKRRGGTIEARLGDSRSWDEWTEGL